MIKIVFLIMMHAYLFHDLSGTLVLYSCKRDNFLEIQGHAATLTLSLGVFSGSMLWWLVLASGASYFKMSLHTTWLNRISGAGLFGFGCVAMSG